MSFLGGLFGPPDVDKLADRRDVRGLIKALSYKKDRYVRQTAANRLGHLGDPAAVPALLEALGDEHSWVRGSAAYALGVLGDPRAVPALVRALRDDLHVSGHAACALGAIGDSAAVPALIEALEYAERPTRKDVVHALGTIGDPDVVPVLVGLLNEGDWEPVVEALRRAGAVAVPALVVALGEGNDWVWPKAARTLEQIGARAVPALIEALDHSNQRLRKLAARTLGKIGSAEALEALQPLLVDENETVRQEAHAALHKTAAPSRLRPRVRRVPQPVGETESGRSAEIRALLTRLPIVSEEPESCRQLRHSHSDALATNTLGPVSLQEAVGQAAKVHAMGKAKATGEAVVVSFAGHAVDDGVAIWRTSKDKYRMFVWYDQVG